MSFEVKTPFFEGPFDLLLFFIRRDELDVHDIPISKITDDFLGYVRLMEEMNMEVASEFILVAATLMRIKAKMLLPRPELDEAGNEIDPREDLVKHLLEYKKYKSVVGTFEVWEGNMMEREKRGNVVQELKQIAAHNDVEAELQDIDLYKLLKVYQKVLDRAAVQKQDNTHQVVPYPYKVEGQKTRLLGQLAFKKKLSFESILQEDLNKVALVFNFLAVLELIAQGEITIIVGEGFNNFWIEKINRIPEKNISQ